MEPRPRSHRWALAAPWLGLDRRAAVALTVLWAVATAANVCKPFHIDDVYYLEEARWIAAHPSRPMSGPMYWITERPEPFHRSNNSPVLVPYLQAAVIAAVGVSPLALHLLTAVFAGLAIVLFHALAKQRAPEHALVLTAVFVLSPSFLAEQNIMLDVPLVASWLAFFVAFEDGSRPAHWWRASSLAALALMIKLTSVALVLFLVLEALRTRRLARLVSLVVPLATLGAWSVWNYLEYGGVQLLARPLEYGVPQLASGRLEVPGLRWLSTLGIVFGRGALWIVTLGGILTGFYALVPSLFTTTLTRRAALGCALGALALLPLGRWLALRGPALLGASQLAGEPLQHTLLRLLFFAVGVLFLGLAASRVRAGDEHDTRLVLWLACAALVVVALSPFVAARHVLVALPPVLFLVARHEGITLAGRGRPMIAVAAVLGLWLALADHRIAAVYPAAAAQLRAELRGPTRATGAVYFVGHWGWQHYASEAGFRPYVPGETVLAPGDVLLEPLGVAAQPILASDRARLSLSRALSIEASGLDLMRSLVDREGLYCAWVGLPWTLRTDPLERFLVHEVR